MPWLFLKLLGEFMAPSCPVSNSISGSGSDTKTGIKNSSGKKNKNPEIFCAKAAISSLFAVENFKVNL